MEVLVIDTRIAEDLEVGPVDAGVGEDLNV
ncbi:MAG: hypothetical protein MOGMAGMI_02622 [Candidatus Omnitrophica bacterium]|nr:hypothetical protein [Candidatus Omnitrophota bacterium]